jgi:hypothetical protein
MLVYKFVNVFYDILVKDRVKRSYITEKCIVSHVNIVMLLFVTIERIYI